MKPALRNSGVFLMAACLGLGSCGDARARSLAASVAKAAHKRVLPNTGRHAATSRMTERGFERQAVDHRFAGAKPRDVIVRRSRTPGTAAHVEQAQNTGQPTVLTLDRKHAEMHRRESLRGVHRRGNSVSGKDRDEYPPAMTREGGFNADVRYVTAKDNRRAGRDIANQARDLPDGARIRVLIGD